jgi:ABC-2 type transport system ATP-binding protein
MIEIKKLCKSYGDKLVLNNLSITIEDGKIFGLVGINGAGKSTLLRLISGIYKADCGDILVDGENVYENENKKKDIFFLPDEPYYGINTTPLNLVDLYLEFYDFNKADYLNYLETFKLPLNKKMHTFSKGMKRQVFVSLALAIKPKYLLLDEAFDGLDPLARLKFKRMIIDLVENNDTTIIISSHSLRELEDICDSYGLIDNGVIESTGNIQEKINTYHKYQVAFSEVVIKEDFDIEFFSYKQDRRIIKVVVKEDLEEFSRKIQKFNPLIIDEINIDFEELFIIEVESRGYIK